MNNTNPYAFERIVHADKRINVLERELKSQRFKHAHVTLRVDSLREFNALHNIMNDRLWPALWTIKLDDYFTDDQQEQLRGHRLAQYVSFLYLRLVLNFEYYNRLHEIYPNIRRLNLHLCNFPAPSSSSNKNIITCPPSLHHIRFSVCTHVDRLRDDILAFLSQIIPSSIKRRAVKTHTFHENFPYDSFNEFIWNYGSESYDPPKQQKQFKTITRLNCDCFSSLWLNVFPNLQHVTSRLCPSICDVLRRSTNIVSLRLTRTLDENDCLTLLDRLPKHVQTVDLRRQPMTDRLLQKAQTKPHLLRFYTARPPGMGRLHRENHVLDHFLHRRAWIQASVLTVFVRAQPLHAFKDSILNILTLILPFLHMREMPWTAEKSSAYMRTQTFHKHISATTTTFKKRKNL